MTSRIDQFHSGSAPADAVTNGMLLTQRLLRELGFESEIYVQHRHPALEGQLQLHTDYRGGSQDLLLVHHSMGHDLTDWITGLGCKRLLVYHNITPEDFFPQGSEIRRYARLGREQLRLFKPHCSRAIADSEFNAQELRALGYQEVGVLPLLFDLESLRHAPYEAPGVQFGARPLSVLFVGRIAENKCIHDLIETFSELTTLSTAPATLQLVGGYEEGSSYYQRLQERVVTLGLEDRVSFRGKVSDATLYGLYRSADVFLCLSEHEGFGVPLIEAMAFDLPVLAYDSSAIRWTLGGAGILFTQKRLREIAATALTVAQDRPLRRALVDQQRQRLEEFSPARLRSELARVIQGFGIQPPTRGLPVPTPGAPRYQIEGPFETSYSLALVNRETASALERRAPGSVALRATEGPGDYIPHPGTLALLPELAPLWKRATTATSPGVVIRNLYPPRVADAQGRINLLSFAWEESSLPEEWVQAFNRHLDGVAVTSHFVKKVLVDAGTTVPVEVVSNGYDHLQRITREDHPGPLGDGFRFLHVSSGFPRKGVDVLLRAWAAAFTSRDEVTLVIKTFPNLHNDIATRLEALRRQQPKLAPVVLIDEDLPPGQLLDLYARCQALVAPSRGEGFGLPLAEAMALGLPVITTAHGGQADFCTPETAWLVDYRFAASQSHLGQFNSVWAEPSWEHLAEVMKEVASSPAALKAKAERAKVLVEQEFTWDACAARLEGLVARIEQEAPLRPRKQRVGWVSTWNTRCGIASYSQYLLDHLATDDLAVQIFASREDARLGPDEENVTRCWGNRWKPDLDELEAALVADGCDTVVFQYNFGFHELRRWGRLLDSLHGRGIRTLVTLHATRDLGELSLGLIRGPLSRVSRILVHSVSDLNTLKGFGLVDNVTVFPHGAHLRRQRSPQECRAELGLPAQSPILASYGFLLPHKGIEQLIEAFALLRRRQPDALLLLINSLYPSELSPQIQASCRQLITRLGLDDSVVMINEFLSEDESLTLLESADLLIFPYQRTGESSSAAVRFGLSANRPVLCTPLDIFRDVQELVHHSEDTTPAALERAIARLLADRSLLEQHQELCGRWLEAHSWPRIARRLSGLIAALCPGPLGQEAPSEPGATWARETG